MSLLLDTLIAKEERRAAAAASAAAASSAAAAAGAAGAGRAVAASPQSLESRVQWVHALRLRLLEFARTLSIERIFGYRQTGALGDPPSAGPPAAVSAPLPFIRTPSLR